jgi:xylulokinase
VAEAAVLGIDLGTTEAKAALVGLDGRLVGLGRASYPMDSGPDGRAEQSPADWWAAVVAAVRSIDAAGVEVVGVCGVGQGPTLAALDVEGMPVRAAITWQDRRAGNGGFGLLPKLAWLAREEPASVERAAWLTTAWDALGLWLSGRAATALQGHETAFDEEALRAAGVPAERVPAPVPGGSVLGPLRATAAAAMGLPAGIPVVAGVNDGMASVLGAGLRAAGDAVDTGGTSGGLAICSDRPLDLPGVYSAPAPLPGRWILGGAMAALGASVDWLRTSVLGERWTPDELFAAAASVAPGADGLVFLPYLAGERAPVFDEAARGAFVGLTLAHGPAHLARAVLEGGAFAVRHVAEPILAAGIPLRELRPAGRPTPDDLWARIKADVLGTPVAIPTIGETAVLGAAILAAAGTGAVPDLEAGVATMTSTARRLEPDPAAHARYDKLFVVYRDLYPALKPAFDAVAAAPS